VDALGALVSVGDCVAELDDSFFAQPAANARTTNRVSSPARILMADTPQ
jgi:hypothetical protein